MIADMIYGTWRLNNSIILLGVLAAFVNCSSLAQAQTQIVNGSFETPALAAGGKQANPTGATWIFSGTSGIANNGSGWNAPTAPDGVQVAYLESITGSTNGSISQTVNFSSPGNYAVTFQSALRSEHNTTSLTINVLIDGTVVGTYTPILDTFTPYTINSLALTAGNHTVQFVIPSAPSGDNSVFIDAVAITGIGNPSFEAPALAAAGKQANPTGASWTFTGSSGIANNGSGWNAPTAPDGTQVAYLQSALGVTNGNISQTSYFPAGTYALTFQAALRAEHNTGPLTINVLIDSTVVGTFTPTLNIFTPYTTNSFAITAGNHTVQFAIPSAPTADNSIFIDLVGMISAPAFANGSFETPALAAAGKQSNPTGATWTFSGTSGIANNGSGWNAPTAPDGVQVAYLESVTGSTNGSISQSCFLPGGTYAISFQAVLRAEHNTGPLPLNILIDGTLVGTCTPIYNQFAAYTTNPFTVAAGNHTVQFVIPSAPTADNTDFIDLVSIIPTNFANASFETPALGAGSQQANPTGASWTFTGLSGIASNGSALNAPSASDGTQVAYLQSATGGTNGSVSQICYFSTGTYALSFQAALGASNNGAVSLNVLVDGTLIGTYTPTSTTSFTSYSTNSNPFSITAGYHTVQFVAVGTATQSSLFLDLVGINAVGLDSIYNGSFEVPALAAAGKQSNPTGASWTFTGLSGIANNGSAWGAPTAPDGTQVAYLQGSTGGTNGSVTQSCFFATGAYTVSFQAALRSGNNGAISLSVSVDGTVVGTYSPTTTSSFTSYATSAFPVTAGYHTLMFAVVGTPVNSTIFVDNVSLLNAGGLANGGFETPALAAGGKQSNPAGATWTFSGTSGIANNGSAWNAPTAPDGVQVAYLESVTGSTNGGLSQTVYFTPGSYTIYFQSALRSEHNTAPVTFNIVVNGSVVGTCTPVLNTFNSYSSSSFNISTAGNYAVQFVIPAAPTADNTVFIDEVSMTGLGSGTYKVIAGNNGQALATSASGTANGTALVTEPYDGGTDKQWTLSSLGNGEYTLMGVASGRYAEVANSGTTAGTPIQLYDYADQDNYKFTMTSDGGGYYTPVFVNSGMAMTVQSNSLQSGSIVEQDAYNASALNDQWTFLAPTDGEGGTAGATFSMVALPDTQHEAQGSIGSSPYMFYDQANWINDQAGIRNINYVIGLGDIVQIGSDTTEWDVAASALYSLTVPYGTVPGNHDFDYNGTTIPSQYTTLNTYNQYFGVSQFSGKSWYGGYESNTPDNNGPENDNHYDLISTSGMDFIIIYMQFHAISFPASMATLPTDLAWVNSVLSEYPNRRAIFVTHQLINSTASWGGGTYDGEEMGEYIYDSLKVHPNLFLMLCGHDADPVGSYRQDTYNGNTVTTILSDYQDPGAPDYAGDGIMRYFQFEPGENLIIFQSYCVETGVWRQQFSIPYTMH